jgi:4-hydroxybenzoyl-CoA thioesterase
MAVFRAERKLRFGDCDPSGIAYFPSYLTLLVGVVEDFWSALGFPWTELMERRRIATPTVHLSCDFARPSRHGDPLVFALDITRIGRSSLELAHRVTGEAELRWSATQVLVATDLDGGGAMPWPPDIRAVLEAFRER